MTRNSVYRLLMIQLLLSLVLTTSGFGNAWTPTSGVKDNNTNLSVEHDFQTILCAELTDEEKQPPALPQEAPVNKEDNKEDSKEDKSEEDSAEKRDITKQYYIAHLDAHQNLKISSFYLHFSYQQVLQPLYILFLSWKSFLI